MAEEEIKVVAADQSDNVINFERSESVVPAAVGDNDPRLRYEGFEQFSAIVRCEECLESFFAPSAGQGGIVCCKRCGTIMKLHRSDQEQDEFSKDRDIAAALTTRLCN